MNLQKRDVNRLIGAALALLTACAPPPAASPTGAPLPIASAPPTATRDATEAPTAVPATAVAPTPTGWPRGGFGGENVAHVPACPDDIATPLFDALPIPLNDFIAYRPLGFMSPPIHIFPAKHSAFSMTLPGNTPRPVPIYAPAKLWVVEIWEVKLSHGGGNYQLFVHPCREVRVYFGHFASIEAELQSAIAGAQPNCRSFNEGTNTLTTCRYDNLKLAMESGEPIGTGPDTAGVDFGVIDFRRQPAAFIRPEHYDSYYPYYAPPIDYFTPDLRAALAAKTGSVFGDLQRTAEPIGGSYMQDVPDTAQGNWFLPGVYFSTTTDSSSFMSLTSDYADPGQPMMTIGNSVRGMSSGLYTFTVLNDGLINRAFKDVTADGNIYCYHQFHQGRSRGGMPLGMAPGMVLIQLTAAESLSIEYLPNASCETAGAWAFSGGAARFER